MVEVQVLGPVSARDDRGTLGVGGPTPCTVLGVLAANAPSVVSLSRLIEAVWGEEPPPSATKTLQAHVSKLRRALARDRDTGAGLIVAAGGGYGLESSTVTTDLAQFRSLAAGAVAADQWRTALDVWRGEPLQGCVDSTLVAAERTRLRTEQLTAITSWASASLRESSPGPVLAEMERLVALHPLHEDLWALLVEAQAATGRRRQALVTYQRAREQLAERAGLEPGPRLLAAETAALRGDGTVTRPDSQMRHRVAVPARRSSIVGRASDVRGLAALAARQRVVTVTGPGGCGKTTVANEAARRAAEDFDGGVVFVDLVPSRDRAGVVRAFAAAWGIRHVGDGDDVVSVIAGQVGDRRTLVVVDNCEHVAGPVADVVDDLLDVAGPVTVLATSRQPLAVGGEALWRLAPLPIDAAVELFLDRMPRTGVREVDQGAVAELCQMLDGLPLGVELAAARAGQLSVTEMIEGLAGRPDLLRTHHRTDGRHDSLAAAIAWSYELLEPVEQACLRRFAVFRGAFDNERAAAVLSGVVDAHDAVAVVADLAAKSLVATDPSSARTTLRLLDTVRAFAWDEAIDRGDAEEAAVRHRDWYLAWARNVRPGSTCLRLAAAYGLAPHHDDLLAALETSAHREEHEAVARLAVLASGLLFCPAGSGDADRWITQALDHADDLPEPVVADLLGAGSLTSLMGTRTAVAAERIRVGADLAVRHRSGAAPLALSLGLAHTGLTRSILSHVETVLAHPAELDDDVHVAIVGMHPFWTFLTEGPQEALAEADRVWATRAWSDDHTMATWAIHAALLHQAGEHGRLRERLDRLERTPGEGPPSPFLSIFEALALAGTGAPQQGLDRLRQVRRHHWVRLPGIENDFLAAVAAIADLSGDQPWARRLLDRPDLWARHPATGLVQLHHRRRLGLPPPPPSLGSPDHTAVSALLDDELGR